MLNPNESINKVKKLASNKLSISTETYAPEGKPVTQLEDSIAFSTTKYFQSTDIDVRHGCYSVQ